MNLNNINVTQLLNQIRDLAMVIVSFIIAVLMVGASVKALGHSFSWLPTLDPTQLAYLAGAFYLVRK